ncbi:MAG: MarR family transcriptional regulator [Pseudomonadota bacterium]
MSRSYRIAHALDRVVRQVDAQMHRRMQVLNADRIGRLGGLTMLYLKDGQPTSIQTLSARMGRDNSQMTRIIRGLETKGVITRRTDEDDLRVVLIELTDSGEDFLGLVREIMSQTVDEVTEPLTEPERDRLYDLLMILLKE